MARTPRDTPTPGDTPPRKRRRWLRWPLRIVLGLLAFVVFALGIAIGVVHTGWFKTYVKDEIVAELQEDFPGSSIHAIEGSPLGTLVIRGITLNGRDGKPMVTIEQVAVRAQLIPLASKRVVVESIRVAGVAVMLREQPPKPDKPPASPSAPSEPSAWSIEIPDVEVTRAKVSIETETGVETIDDVDLTAAAWLRARSPLVARAHATAKWRGHPVSAFALLEDGDTTRVPLASVVVGTARALVSDVELAGGDAFGGALLAAAPQAFLEALVESDVPGDIDVAASARTSGAVMVHASAGPFAGDAYLAVDVAALRGHAIVATTRPEGSVAVAVAFDANPTRTSTSPTTATVASTFTSTSTSTSTSTANLATARGIVSAIATLTDTETGEPYPRVDAMTGFDARIASTTTLVELVAAAATPGGDARATATVQQDGELWKLARSTVDVHVPEFAAWRSYIDAPVSGEVEAHVEASGILSPEVALAVVGTVNGKRIVHEMTRVARVTATFAGDGLPTRMTLDTTVDARGISSGTTRVPAAFVAATVDSVDDGRTTVLALGRHRVTTVDGRLWTGSGGKVTIGEEQIVVERVQTGSGRSSITASAKLGRLTGDMEAKVRARDVSLAIADPKLRGDADADVDVAFVRGRWRGTATVNARAVERLADAPRGTSTRTSTSESTKLPPLDVDAKVTIAGRRVEGTATVRNDRLGSATTSVAVTGPRDITDAMAWKQLTRAAVDKAGLRLDNIDATVLGGTGSVEGGIELRATDVRGGITVRGVETKAGPLTATLTVSPGDVDMVRARAIAQVEGLPPVNMNATLVLPDRPFDPDAWRVLGRRALHAAEIEIAALDIDPQLLARLGETSPYSARVGAKLVVDEGAHTTTLTATARNITGGSLTAPAEVDVSIVSDGTGTRANVKARAAGVTGTATATTPLTIDAALAGGARTTTIEADATLPPIAARELLGLVGNATDVLAGTVGGTVKVSGPVGAPVVHAQVTAENVSMRSTLSNKKPATLAKLTVNGLYKAGERYVELDVEGLESDNRLLKLSARGRPDDLKSVTASLQAANFDLTPLAAFAPGNLRGARGTLNAALTIRGLDPQSGDVRGMLQIRDGRLPLSPELGTLRRASVDVDVIKQTITAKLDGRLGAGGGGVTGKLTMQLVGGLPQSAKLEAKVRKVAPIGALQPQIDGDITGNWTNVGFAESHAGPWTGKLVIEKGKVYVPPEGGNELLGLGAPADMYFIEGDQIVKKKVRKLPTKPWLVTKVVLGKTAIQVDDADVKANLVASGQLVIEVGDGVSYTGTITTERGAVDVLGRRYRIDTGLVVFDGLPDPRLQIMLVHDFKNLTLSAEIYGRASDPGWRLKGDPGGYTDGQLISFFLGAEPGNDDSNAQANQAVVSGGLTFLSSRLGRHINKHLPVKFDTINYEAATTSSSRAVRFGLRLSEKTYLLWRQRLEARPDENPGEILLEYQVRPNALFEVTVGERSTGGDFLLRTRW